MQRIPLASPRLMLRSIFRWFPLHLWLPSCKGMCPFSGVCSLLCRSQTFWCIFYRVLGYMCLGILFHLCPQFHCGDPTPPTVSNSVSWGVYFFVHHLWISFALSALYCTSMPSHSTQLFLESSTSCFVLNMQRTIKVMVTSNPSSPTKSYERHQLNGLYSFSY